MGLRIPRWAETAIASARLRRWHSGVRAGRFQRGVFAAPSIDRLAAIGRPAAEYVASVLTRESAALCCARQEIDSLTARDAGTAARTRFFVELLDQLPGYRGAMVDRDAPPWTQPIEDRDETDVISEAEIREHERVAEGLLYCELLGDLVVSIARYLEANPDPRALPALVRRIELQLDDPSAWFLGRYEAIEQLFAALSCIDPEWLAHVAMDLDAGLNHLRGRSACAHLVPDRDGEVWVANAGWHRIRRPSGRLQDLDRFMKATMTAEPIDLDA